MSPISLAWLRKATDAANALIQHAGKPEVVDYRSVKAYNVDHTEVVAEVYFVDVVYDEMKLSISLTGIFGDAVPVTEEDAKRYSARLAKSLKLE